MKTARSIASVVLIVLAIVLLVRVAMIGNHAADQINRAVGPLQHAKTTFDNAVQQGENSIQNATKPALGTPCTPWHGGHGLIVYHNFDNGYDCVPQLP